MDFYKAICQFGPIHEAIFGLCDDQAGSPAYVDTTNPTNWVATVKNSSNKNIVFTAVDKCVLLDGEENGRGRCDCMLTTNELIYFVELKDQAPPWMPHAKDQLKSTIEFFKANHDISRYRHRKAFACNKRRPPFVVIDQEESLDFYRTYGFRLDIQAEIIIV